MGQHRLQSDLEGANFSSTVKAISTPEGFVLGCGASVPSAVAGWAPGAIFTDTTNGVIYRNDGTLTSCSFTNLIDTQAEIVGPLTLDAGGVTIDQASAAGTVNLRLGGSATEGLEIKVMEETLSLASLGAKYKAMTNPLPAGAVILSAQANIETLVVAGGTTVKVALGINDGDVDAYGISADLAKNTKIDTIPDWAVLAAETTIDVCGVVTDGSALGSDNITAGSVRVRIVYAVCNSLDNA